MTHKLLNTLAQTMAWDAIGGAYDGRPQPFEACSQFAKDNWGEDWDGKHPMVAVLEDAESDPVSLGYLRGCFDRAVRNAGIRSKRA